MHYKQFKHQAKEYREHRRTKARALYWQMRTGKTKAMIDLAFFNYLAGYIDAVVVIAPNGVHENWTRIQLPEHAWRNIPWSAVAWSSNRARKPAFRDSLSALIQSTNTLPFLALNEECFTVPLARGFLKKFMTKRQVLIIYDESQGFGTPGAKRTKAGRATARLAVMNRTLSGTPLDNSPLKAFSQFELLEKCALGFQTFEDFKNHFAEYRQEKSAGGRVYPVLTHYKNLDELKQLMAPYTSVVLRSDCDDMPSLLRSVRLYEPSKEQMALYRKLFKKSVMELKDGTIATYEGGVRTLKMQQVLGGFFVDADGELTILPGKNPRLDALMEEVQCALWNGKVIIWARFRVEIDLIADRLRKAGITFVQYHGGISNQDKQIARETFLTDKTTQVFLGQPRAGGKGLDLSSARTVVRYSYSFDAEENRQAEERATKIGSVDIDLIDIVASNWIDDDINQLIDSYILERLEDKSVVAEDLSRSGMQAYLLDMLV